jgi:glycerol-3-phosphate cytidylyltransferase
MGRVAYTGGSFDGLHVGHLELLRACRELAGWDGRVVVALNTDAFIERYKGRPPVHPYAHRREELQACRFVDLVVRNAGDEDSGRTIEVVEPDVLVIGDDWFDDGAPDPQARYLAQLGLTHQWLAERHLHVEYVPRTRGVSSSELRARVLPVAGSVS